MARQDPTQDSCVVMLFVGGSLLAGLSFLADAFVRWLS